AVADVGISETEAGSPVIVLLRGHAVEPDDARTSMRHRRLPEPQPVAMPAQIRTHDVEAEKGEAIVIVDTGYGSDRHAVTLGQEKAVGIDHGEAGSIGQTGIPALGCRPVEGQGNLVWAHWPDGEAVDCSTAG